jgi:NADPH:quinone reductase-like Zn-dependent oxidoreductase
VNYRARSNWGQEVLKLTGGTGVDLAIDIGGTTTLDESITATAMNGVVGIVGVMGGLSATLNLAEILQKNLRLEGIETGSRAMLEEMIGWFAQKRLIPLVDRVYPFTDSRAAFRHLRNGGHMGKVCIAFPGSEDSLLPGNRGLSLSIDITAGLPFLV